MRLEIAPEVIWSAQAGSPSHMDALLEKLWPHAYRIALSVVQDRLIAEDAAQEACAIVYNSLGHLRSADVFRFWVSRIIVREALRLAKRDAITIVIAHESEEPDIDARLDVLRALKKLPPRIRAVVVLHYYAGLNSGEIGNVLGIPSATVRFRLARARAELADILSTEPSPLPRAQEIIS